MPSLWWACVWKRALFLWSTTWNFSQILFENCSGKRPNKITRTSSNISYDKWKINHSCKDWGLKNLHSKKRKSFKKHLLMQKLFCRGAISADKLKKWLLGDVINLSELWALLVVQMSLTDCTSTWEIPYSLRPEVHPALCSCSDRDSWTCCLEGANELSLSAAVLVPHNPPEVTLFVLGMLGAVPLSIPFSSCL